MRNVSTTDSSLYRAKDFEPANKPFDIHKQPDYEVVPYRDYPDSSVESLVLDHIVAVRRQDLEQD